ncbi:OmpA family protein [Rufibacter latericius]|uniref:OmpA family protein n=1 Tax=Rufibacter latericius TaxID=2487040 RepID=A0A3M9N020_9BACT|nr:OmpA family protein [Rufibacter latericius]RNI31152.1 OmpA family protein [Rufibacter latericius]
MLRTGSFLIFLLSLFLSLSATGQNKPALRLKQRPVTDSLRKKAPEAEVVLNFPNINRTPYYYQKSKYEAILKLEKKKDWNKVLPLLAEYVGNFGIDNFYKDTKLLWRLGQLYERLGQREKAVAYYRLVLKHHRTDIRQVQQYYDSLEQKNKDLYVPLQYYYELVEYRKSVATFKPPRGVYTNMGDAINSKAEDYGPAVRSDEELFIYTSRRKGVKATGTDEDLYFSRFENGFWHEGESFGKPINSIYNEGSACLSRDGNTLYFARCESPDGMGNCDLYSATRQADGSWGQLKNLGANVNSKSWDSQPTLSPQEDTLYFASDRLGGFGMSDIYFTHKQKSGQWAPAQNLGPIINTRESEVSPYFHPLYQVLYFSSRGQLLNFGDFDIYKAYRIKGNWQEPRNIGPLVNGKGSEYYFTINANSTNLYYARSEPTDLKNLDLYSFPLPMEAHPLAVTKLTGVLMDSVTNRPLNGIISIIDLDNGIEVASKYLREDGSFDFDLIDNSRYMMLIQSSDFFSIEKEINLKEDTVMKIMTSLIDYSIPLIFKNLEFDEGKAEIKDAMKPTLDRIVLFLVDHPQVRLSIEGHTDSSGDPDANLELSQWRAVSIQKYLESKGNLASGRIDAVGKGSSEPIKPELTIEDRAVNRRVEFKLIKPKDAGTGDGDW